MPAGGMMNLRRTTLIVAAFLFVGAVNLSAQDDKFGAVDTVFIEPYKIDALNWGINVSLFNDEEIIALSLPLTFSDGKNRIVADSTIFTGGLVEKFKVKEARSDTAMQCLTIGLINDIGVSVPPLPPGRGRIATVFVSSIDKKEISSLKVDTTTTPPSNTLLLVKQPSDPLVPALVIKAPAKSEKK